MKSILTTVLLFGLIACSENPKDNKETKLNEIEYSNYEAKEYNLKISYPKGWDTTKADERMILTIVEHKISKEDPFNDNILLYKTQMPSKLTLDSVLNLAITTMAQQYQGAKLISTKIGKNAMNKDYATFKMISQQKNTNLVSIAYYFPIDNDFYVLNLGYVDKDSIKYQPICDKVFNSVTFK